MLFLQKSLNSHKCYMPICCWLLFLLLSRLSSFLTSEITYRCEVNISTCRRILRLPRVEQCYRTLTSKCQLTNLLYKDHNHQVHLDRDMTAKFSIDAQSPVGMQQCDRMSGHGNRFHNYHQNCRIILRHFHCVEVTTIQIRACLL